MSNTKSATEKVAGLPILALLFSLWPCAWGHSAEQTTQEVTAQQVKELEASLAEGIRSSDWTLIDLPIQGLVAARKNGDSLEKSVQEAQLQAALALLDPKQRAQLTAWTWGAQAKSGAAKALQELHAQAGLSLERVFEIKLSQDKADPPLLHFHALACLAYLGEEAAREKLYAYASWKMEELGDPNKSAEFLGRSNLSALALRVLARLKDSRAGPLAREWLKLLKDTAPETAVEKQPGARMRNFLMNGPRAQARRERLKAATEVLSILDPAQGREELGRMLVDKDLTPGQRNELFRLMNGKEEHTAWAENWGASAPFKMGDVRFLSQEDTSQVIYNPADLTNAQKKIEELLAAKDGTPEAELLKSALLHVKRQQTKAPAAPKPPELPPAPPEEF